jgi:DNA repair exonuclease SbcCD nuclease subunit
LFKKAAVFTDLHLGLKSNSKTHNQDCEEFVDWFIEQAQKNNCDTGIFCGDWNHNRNSLNITTMDTGIRLLEKLGNSFENFYMFAGNHDLYYKDKRDIKSTEFARHIPGVTVIDEITQLEDVALVPWLVEEEYKRVANMDCKYMFGHFELPTFLMNAKVRMPDHSGLNANQLTKPEYVFTGHFHSRQSQKNVHYIGNAFPHNYADAWDDDRGMMILDRENSLEPEYINWDDCPKYRTIKLSRLIDETDSIMKSKMYLRVELDCPVTYEEASFLKDMYMNQYKCREITLIPQKQIEEIDSELDISAFASVDQIVSEEISSLDTDNFDKKMLLDIYNGLE